jgi:hypothetical protein
MRGPVDDLINLMVSVTDAGVNSFSAILAKIYAHRGGGGGGCVVTLCYIGSYDTIPDGSGQALSACQG